MERSSLFVQMPTLAEGRRRHLQGIFESRDISAGSKRIEGAKELYMLSMTSANRIQDLDTNVNLQKAMGLAPLPRENKQMWERRLDQSKQILWRATNTAKFWMALVHQATGNLEVAQDWLENRVLAEESSHWRPAAHYNLGRIREDLGDLDAARQAYRADTSAQRHGSLWRARRLRRLQEASPPAQSST
jgi:hypothetical protein